MFLKATDEQLETITKHDPDCPPSLLRKVVEEMLNRNLFDRVINSCIQGIVNVERMKNIYKLDIEDFMQMGRMEIFRAVDRFETGRGMTFSSFIFMVVKHEFGKFITILTAKKRDLCNEFSYHAETSSETELIDFFTANTNVEKYVINKMMIELLIERVTDRQKEVIMLKLEGYNDVEIGEILGGISHQAVGQSYTRAVNNMRKGA
ncbi:MULTISPECIES: sigma-70 family RNA polymerase sigma factor [Peribacillus]|uniref:sigma-70 family RNA polymerase sigma factor n=1 Tax=Peribacillus TaxID=2675229 RepID=UPI001F4E34AA|nr:MULTISPECIES: sigma-70 family RNA polymerase sigma factor [unclassified Peribacillus]MCK1982207.1 sigma-70 family RNA polymerase sigma factor [Peribacillus sp. Aquil_B1]MCK2007441.1 sigma-70 family RNA polymerase sigma factor [Peribacillus sp. Aquil_B8]